MHGVVRFFSGEATGTAGDPLLAGRDVHHSHSHSDTTPQQEQQHHVHFADPHVRSAVPSGVEHAEQHYHVHAPELVHSQAGGAHLADPARHHAFISKRETPGPGFEYMNRAAYETGQPPSSIHTLDEGHHATPGHTALALEFRNPFLSFPSHSLPSPPKGRAPFRPGAPTVWDSYEGGDAHLANGWGMEARGGQGGGHASERAHTRPAGSPLLSHGANGQQSNQGEHNAQFVQLAESVGRLTFQVEQERAESASLRSEVQLPLISF